MKSKIILLLIFTSLELFAQSVVDIKHKYESFEYRQVIDFTNNLLLSDTSLTKNDFIELHKMKAISYFSLAESDSARYVFIEILKMDPEFSLDPIRTSPKILVFFNGIKDEFNEILSSAKLAEAEERTIIPSEIEVFDHGRFNNSLIRSTVLPGWGHLFADENTAGLILTSAGTLNLGTLVYFIIDSDKKQNNYLNETDVTKISDKYNKYNTSYKIRNILIASYAAIWLYSQIDLIFYSHDMFTSKIKPTFAITETQNSTKLNFSFQIFF